MALAAFTSFRPFSICSMSGVVFPRFLFGAFLLPEGKRFNRGLYRNSLNLFSFLIAFAAAALLLALIMISMSELVRTPFVQYNEMLA
jgi:hypothetical protein